MSITNDITAAVAAEVKALVNNQFEVAYGYLPRYSASDLGELKITCAPRAMSVERDTRGTLKSELTVDIAVQKRVSDESELPELGNLVDGLFEQMTTARLRNFPLAVCVQSTRDTLFDMDALTQQKVFSSVFNLVYRFAIRAEVEHD